MKLAFDFLEFLLTRSSAALNKKERRAAKAGNKYGSPIALKSKILAAIPDPRSPSSAVLVAESAGAVRLVNLDVRTVPIYEQQPPTIPPFPIL